MQFGGITRHIVIKLAVNKNPVRRDGQRRGFLQPDMAVNARALVKPALESRGVHADGQHVLAAVIGNVRDVVTEGIVAANLTANQAAVEINQAVAIDAAEFEPEPPAKIRLWQRERAAIPGDAVLWKAGAARLEALVAVRVPVERQRHRPVMRQIHAGPGTVIEAWFGGAGADPQIDQFFARVPVIAQMKLPAKIHQQFFARRIRRSQGVNGNQGCAK